MPRIVLPLAALVINLAVPACCVAASTLVRTPHGEVPLGTLTVGDVVCSIDVSTGRRITDTIVQVRRATRETVALRWSGGSLVCTPDHPLYAPETGTYRPASDWISGTARTLLVTRGDGVEIVGVTDHDSFAGVHEVVDITLAAEPHNFIAAGVVVHNKSPAPDFATAEAIGPDLELGAGEEVQFRVRVCLDGGEAGDPVAVFTIDAATATVPTDNIPAQVTVTVDDTTLINNSLVPFEETAGPEGGVSCGQGMLVTFRRSDAGTTGSSKISWSVEGAIDRVDEGADDDAEVTVSIVAEP